VFNLVQSCVDACFKQQGRHGVRTDRVVAFDASNGLIDGLCYLFFCDDEQSPAIVAKAARTPAGKAIFEVEYENLEALQARGMNASRHTVPDPLGKWYEDDTLVTLQSALPGVLMMNVPGSSLFSPTVVDINLDRVVDWWVHFQNCFGVRRVTLAGDTHDEMVIAPIHLFRRRYLLDGDEESFLTRRFERERVLDGVELPFMARHGDFCVANMVMDEDGGIGVFDWEFRLQHQVPLFDLFFFFASVRFPYTGPMGESSHFKSFVSVYWEDNFYRTAVQKRLRHVCTTFDLPHETLADLLVLSLIQAANMKYDGLLESHGMVEPEDSGATNEEKRARWRRFDHPDLDAPFACIQGGIFENLRLLVRRGLPEM
jgi:hypothetical protein